MMTTRTTSEIADELTHLQSEVAILTAARDREAGIVPEREAAAARAQAAYTAAQAAHLAAGEIVNGILMMPYIELAGASPREYAQAAAAQPDGVIPAPAEVARLQRRYAEAKEAKEETRQVCERAIGAASQARERADFLGQQIAIGGGMVERLVVEQRHARERLGTPAPSRLDNARARLGRLREQFMAPAAPAKGA